jgi:uncharacterized protein YecT (DUF1311 family)
MEIAMPRAALVVVLWFAMHPTVQACGDEPLPEELTAPQSERELAAAYEHALESSGSREPLERAQQLWEEYRQANCELMSARDAGPSPEASAQCHAFMARERIFELRLLSY